MYWNRAATQGYNIARLKLGDYYYYGKGTDMFNLAYMHENGLGLRRDMHLAKRFYDMALETSSEAHFPVTLALLKLNILFLTEDLLKNYSLERIFTQPVLMELFGELWDIYLMIVLVGAFSALYLLRRHR